MLVEYPRLEAHLREQKDERSTVAVAKEHSHIHSRLGRGKAQALTPHLSCVWVDHWPVRWVQRWVLDKMSAFSPWRRLLVFLVLRDTRAVSNQSGKLNTTHMILCKAQNAAAPLQGRR